MVGVVRAGGVPGLDVGEVVEHLAVGGDVVPDGLVVVLQHLVGRAVGVAGHVDEGDAGVVGFESGHGLEVGVDGGGVPGELPAPGPHEGVGLRGVGQQGGGGVVEGGGVPGPARVVGQAEALGRGLGGQGPPGLLERVGGRPQEPRGTPPRSRPGCRGRWSRRPRPRPRAARSSHGGDGGEVGGAVVGHDGVLAAGLGLDVAGVGARAPAGEVAVGAAEEVVVARPRRAVGLGRLRPGGCRLRAPVDRVGSGARGDQVVPGPGADQIVSARARRCGRSRRGRR